MFQINHGGLDDNVSGMSIGPYTRLIYVCTDRPLPKTQSGSRYVIDTHLSRRQLSR